MIVLVTGDRNWTDEVYLYQVLDVLHQGPEGPISLVIEGECHTEVNADKMSREWAKSRGVDHLPMPAQWKRYGRGAGPIRNGEMLKVLLANPSSEKKLCAAFHENIHQSSGTRDMMKQCRKAGIETRLFPEQKEGLIY